MTYPLRLELSVWLPIYMILYNMIGLYLCLSDQPIIQEISMSITLWTVHRVAITSGSLKLAFSEQILVIFRFLWRNARHIRFCQCFGGIVGPQCLKIGMHSMFQITSCKVELFSDHVCQSETPSNHWSLWGRVSNRVQTPLWKTVRGCRSSGCHHQGTLSPSMSGMHWVGICMYLCGCWLI